jgi:hypothetical protein
MFFLPSIKETEEEKNERTNFEIKIRAILDKYLINNIGLLVFNDNIPVLFSFGKIAKRRYLVLSTGLLKMLDDTEIELLIYRETHFLKRLDTGLFTAAVFIPFVLNIISSWFFEVARFNRLKQSSTAPQLAGAIFYYLNKIMEFPLLFASRKRHSQANATLSDLTKIIKVNDKISEIFLKVPDSGIPFRKKIYESLHPLLPFDFEKNSMIEIWRKFLNVSVEATSYTILGAILEKWNFHFKTGIIFSSHPSYQSFFKQTDYQKIEEPTLNIIHEYTNSTKMDFFIKYIPLFCFLFGLLISIILRSWFGIPLIFLGIGILIQCVYSIRKSSFASKESLTNWSVLDDSGILRFYPSPGELECPYVYLATKTMNIPIILKQLFRSDDPLINYNGEVTSVQGKLRIENIPYIEIKRISLLSNEKKTIRSASLFLQFLISAALIISGSLIILLQTFQ